MHLHKVIKGNDQPRPLHLLGGQRRLRILKRSVHISDRPSLRLLRLLTLSLNMVRVSLLNLSIDLVRVWLFSLRITNLRLWRRES
jgi:hypothetical protein